MNVSVIGSGYVGLVSAACLAELGHDVVCVDIDASKVEEINRGRSPIHEPGLDDILKKNIGKRMKASCNLNEAVLGSDLSLIAVGTPYRGDRIDLTHIEEVSRQIGTVLKEKDGYHLVVVKSTVVPGTTDGIVLPLLEKTSGKTAGKDFGIGMNPEFLREGEAVKDFMNPDRIVLGAIDDRSRDALSALYDCFPSTDKILTTPKTAEMIKYTSNSLLAALISFSNEIGNLCSAIGDGVDVVEVMKAVHLDKRLSPILDNGRRVVPAITTYLEAGCGFGGSCFPKDVKALIAYGRDFDQPMGLMREVIRINDAQPGRVVELLDGIFPSLEGVRVSVLGLAFKPGTDDIRESPAIAVVKNLLERKAIVSAYDPVAAGNARKALEMHDIDYCESLSQAVARADAVVVMTRWEEFNQLPNLLQSANPEVVVVDGRRMLDKSTVRRYAGIGLGVGP
ncbi:MAG: UDP-glucose dehydrogenase family protein [Desulfobacterales bacterium]